MDSSSKSKNASISKDGSAKPERSRPLGARPKSKLTTRNEKSRDEDYTGEGQVSSKDKAAATRPENMLTRVTKRQECKYKENNSRPSSTTMEHPRQQGHENREHQRRPDSRHQEHRRQPGSVSGKGEHSRRPDSRQQEHSRRHHSTHLEHPVQHGSGRKEHPRRNDSRSRPHAGRPENVKRAHPRQHETWNKDYRPRQAGENYKEYSTRSDSKYRGNPKKYDSTAKPKSDRTPEQKSAAKWKVSKVPQKGQWQSGQAKQKQDTGGRPSQRQYTSCKFQHKWNITVHHLTRLQQNEPENIVMELLGKQESFEDLLKNIQPHSKELKPLISVLAKACDCPMSSNLNRLLTSVVDTPLMNSALPGFIYKMPAEKSEHVREEFSAVLLKVLLILLKCMERLPSYYDSVLGPLGAVEVTFGQLRDNNILNDKCDDILSKLTVLKGRRDDIMERERTGARVKATSKTATDGSSTDDDKDSGDDPPDDFREKPEFPTPEEIRAGSQPFLRPNLVVGPYRDLEHYLDVQYRLYREDFVAPLREGIQEYVASLRDGRRKRLQDIRVYNGVSIIHPNCTNQGLTHTLRFDNSRLQKVNWEFSKRLIFGSLVCLSVDGFHTLIFATVANRDPKALRHGNIDVRFEGGADAVARLNPGDMYVMVETSAYFESYRHVLKRIQEIEAGDLPFERFIVRCDLDIGPPRYLVRPDDDNPVRYDLTPLLGIAGIDKLRDREVKTSGDRRSRRRIGYRYRQNQRESEDEDEEDERDDVSTDDINQLSAEYPQLDRAKSVPILEIDAWPSGEDLQLDESQLGAVQTALTRQFSVIQGPPGTGKTYIGLKIVKALIHNKEMWKTRGAPRPLLVVCYTNHALDQFLEGIHEFLKTGIARAGSRSGSEVLKQFMLSELKHNRRKMRSVPHNIHRGIFRLKDEMKGLTESIAELNEIIKDVGSEKKILSDQTLETFMSPRHISNIGQGIPTLGLPNHCSIFHTWLDVIKYPSADQASSSDREAVAATGTKTNGQYMTRADASGQANGLSDEDGFSSDGSELDDVGYVGYYSVLSTNANTKAAPSQNLDIQTAEHSYNPTTAANRNDPLTYYGSEPAIACRQDVDEVALVDVEPGKNPVDTENSTVENSSDQTDNATDTAGDGETPIEVESEAKVAEMQRLGEVEYEVYNTGNIEEGSNGTPGSNLAQQTEEREDSENVILDDGFQLVINWNDVQRRIRIGRRNFPPMDAEEAARVDDVWQLPWSDRWRLYNYWVLQHINHYRQKVLDLQTKYEALAEELEELGHEEDLSVLQDATVIGMTTTAAARYRKILERVSPKIIVVEEAAEVLEAHIITTLTRGCEHLILIGDHQQLRPNPTVYKLAKDFNLDYSLFERMVKNGLHPHTLSTQHRMRPEISVLMKHIYPTLLDHESVMNFDTISGIDKNIFFINHNKEEIHNEELLSHVNAHEAEYVVALCRYLIQQGYDKSRITILTTYKGQLYKLKGMMKKKVFEGVRVTVVDNFQGEENDIILLSLVRSNRDGSIGFLSISNRVCVALSRARMGFYCIGNISMLAKKTELWSNIKVDMEERGCIGQHLMLRCQIHQDTAIEARSANDFKAAPEGGCTRDCDVRLKCGHRCRLPCHPADREHKEYKCYEKCPMKCDQDHACPKYCWEDCGPCKVRVPKIIPSCGHEQMVPCGVSPAEFRCRKPCEKILQCNHKCQNNCGNPCTDACKVQVTKEWPCGHNAITDCHRNPKTTPCRHPCPQQLECGHLCQGTCGSCLQGRLHVPCRNGCGRNLVCSHQCRFPCTSDCPPCRMPCENRCFHSRCQHQCGGPCPPCNEPCEWHCRHHQCTRLCGEMCNRLPCNKPCRKKLPCRHPCIGLCGEPCPTKCRVCNHEEVTTILFGTEDERGARFIQLEDCGHIVEVSALDMYMTQNNLTDETVTVSIQLKVCPWCKTPIRRNLRYGNFIKEALADIEEVKRKVRGSTDEILRQATSIKEQVTTAGFLSDPGNKNAKRKLEDKLVAMDHLTSGEVAVVQTQFEFLTVIDGYDKMLRKKKGSLTAADRLLFQRRLDLLKTKVTDDRFKYRMSDQEVNDLHRELKRVHLEVNLSILTYDIDRHRLALGQQESTEMQALQAILDRGAFVSSDDLDNGKAVLESIRRRHPELSALTKEQKAEIVRAIGLSKGHWYKCPKGHFYAIGECGGANQGGRCPDCGLAIGGQNHRLAEGNVHAPEMDNSPYAAWSEAANMNNFNLDNLA